MGTSGAITGSGTTNYLPKFTSASGLGNSQVFDDGTNVGVGTTVPRAFLEVIGNGKFSGGLSTVSWTDPMIDYHCGGVVTSTTGTISTGTNSLVVASASGWDVGMGIAVHNAGAGGTTELITSVTAIVGTTFTLANNASATATTQAVYHDDTTCLNNAIASGKNINGRLGQYNVTSALSVTTPLIIAGDGKVDGALTPSNGMIIWNRGSTNHVFDVTTGYIDFHNFTIQQDTSVTPSAGSAILLHHASTTQYSGNIGNIRIKGTYNGISITGHISAWFIHDIWMNIRNYGVFINNASPAGGVDWKSIIVSPTIANSGTGFYLTNADTNTYTNVYATGMGKGLLIDASNGPVVQQKFVAANFENNNPGIEISSSALGDVKSILFSGLDAGQLYNGSQVTCIDIKDHAEAIQINGATINNCLKGILLESDGTDFIFNGITFEGNATGLELAAGTSVGTTFLNNATFTNTTTNVSNASNYSLSGTYIVGSNISTNLNMGTSGNASFVANGRPNSNRFVAFELQDNATAKGRLALERTPTTLLGAGVDDTLLYTNSTNNLVFGTNATENMRIQSGGNVGIGSSSPIGKLNVIGDEVRIWTGAGTDTNALASGELYVEGDLEVDGTVYMGSCSGAGCGSGGGSSNVAIGTTIVGGTNNTVLYTDGSGNLATGFTFDGTNVGIGTSATVGKMTIKGAGTTTGINFRTQNSSNTALVTMLDNGNIGVGTTTASQLIEIAGSSPAYSFVNTGSSNKQWRVAGIGNDLSFVETGVSTWMKMLATTGNIGMGSTVPQGKLVIQGTGTTTAKALVVQNSSATEKVVVLDNGNVGIGTSLGVTKLHISGDGANPATALYNAAADNILLSNNSDTTGQAVLRLLTADADDAAAGTTLAGTRTRGSLVTPLTVTSGDRMLFVAGTGYDGTAQRTASGIILSVDAAPASSTVPGRIEFGTTPSGGAYTERMRIQSGGNVGVGTSTPQNLLDIRGNHAVGTYAGLNAAPTNGMIISGNTGIGTSTVATSAKLTVAGNGTTTAPNTQWQASGGTAKVTILDNGNVGIGTTAPEGALAIRLSTSDAGWTRQSAANQACNTTCTATCLFGFDQGTLAAVLPSIVDCADAAADQCICAGSN